MSKRYYERTITEEDKQIYRIRGRDQKRYFNKVYVNVTAASKMLSHANFGQPLEVMGLLQGSYHEQSNHGVFVITDVIFLPVESSETRVTADGETYKLIADYTLWNIEINTHNLVGWYHSHPSFGCWLSGIDVNTQELFQKSCDPFVAIVVDPIKTVNLQKLDMAAFRVHPNNQKQQNTASMKNVPRRKAVDLGYHHQKYYQLPIQFMANDLAQKTLKNIQKIEWVSELAHSSFFNQSEYLKDQANDQKLDIEEYLQVKQNPSVKYSEIKEKQKDTLQKIAYYTKERNISLIDSAVKSLLF